MFSRLLLVLPVALTLLPASVGPQAPLVAQPLCFPGVAGVIDCIDAPFLDFWTRSGGLPVFGYPTGPALPDETEPGPRAGQHFERYRLESHPDAPAPYTVQLGRLGAERLAQLRRTVEPVVSAAPGCRFFAETGHNVCGGFLAYWRSHGLELGDRGVSERESLALTEPDAAQPPSDLVAGGRKRSTPTHDLTDRGAVCGFS